MPSLYVDGALMELIRDEVSTLEREAKQSNGGDDVYVSEKEALEELLSEDAKRRLERIR